MTSIDRRTLRKLEKKILLGLVDFYYESGHKSEGYRDPDSGGLYEHKLAHKLGFALAPGDRSPPEFLEACRMLEAQGLVHRIKRTQEFPELGIWPTFQGLDRAEYLAAAPLERLALQLKTRWPEIVVSVLTTVATLTVSWFLGLFGLKAP